MSWSSEAACFAQDKIKASRAFNKDFAPSPINVARAEHSRGALGDVCNLGPRGQNKAGRGGVHAFCPQDSAHSPHQEAATMRQEVRSSMHNSKCKTSFPNISSRPEGDRPRQKVGNDFFVFALHLCLLMQTALRTTCRAREKQQQQQQQQEQEQRQQQEQEQETKLEQEQEQGQEQEQEQQQQQR